MTECRSQSPVPGLPRIIPGTGSGRQASNLFISVGDLTPIETDL